MSDHYKVVDAMQDAAGTNGCSKCGHGAMWEIVEGTGSEEVEVAGQSWGDRELADDICALMNMAHAAGCEQSTNNKEETKLVNFFRSKVGSALGREGDYDNLTPAETAIRVMRKYVEIKR